MTDTQYEWRHETPRIRPDGERIADGDPIDPTPHELRVWPDRIVAVETTDGGESDTDDDPAVPADVETVDGIGPKRAESLRAIGIKTVADLQAATVSDLADAGLSGAVADRVLSEARDG